MTTVLQAGEGEQLGGATTVATKAGGEQTGGTFYLGEVVAQPGFPGPPRHIHEQLHDMFYVLDGTLTLHIGDKTIALTQGGFVCFPPGVVHTFSNQSDGAVRFLNFNTPSGWKHYMRDLDNALSEGAPTQAIIGEIASRYDLTPV